MWSHDSTDWYQDTDAPFDLDAMLKDFTPGSIILFHSCNKHEKRTKIILPLVLQEISKRELSCAPITPDII